MGMAAGQARLLSITARLTDNENTGQSISYSKQRLADQTQTINNEYNEALAATKLTVLTGFNGADAQYTDISFNLMTGTQMAENTKQYVVTDAMGKVMVPENIADAYTSSKGDYNKFLASLGYSQADITLQYKNRNADITANPGKEQAYLTVEEKIHQAWDKYFESVGIDISDNDQHGPEFSFTTTYLTDAAGNYLDANGNVTNTPETNGTTAPGYGYAGYMKQTDYVQQVEKDADGNYIKNPDGSYKYVFNADGTPKFETTEYDYLPSYNENGEQEKDKNGNAIYNRVKLDQPRNIKAGETIIQQNEDGQYIAVKDIDGNAVSYESTTNGAYLEYKGGAAAKVYEPINYEGTTKEQRELYNYALALTEAYLREDYVPADYKTAADSDNTSALTYYKNLFNKMSSSGFFAFTNNANKVMDGTGVYKYSKEKDKSDTPEKDNTVFENMLRNGELRLEYYNTTQKKFISTSISDDESIQEVKDERKIAAAENKYTQDLSALENKDKKLDLELKKLDTEHNALQTEYDSVKNVIDKNIEKSFNVFS